MGTKTKFCQLFSPKSLTVFCKNWILICLMVVFQTLIESKWSVYGENESMKNKT